MTTNVTDGSSDGQQAAVKPPLWQRLLKMAVLAIVGIFAALMVIGKVTTFGKLPACDASNVKDTLSDLNKKQEFNASRYNSIRERGRTDDEVLCTANLELRAGGSVEYDFRIYKEESGTKVMITDIRR